MDTNIPGTIKLKLKVNYDGTDRESNEFNVTVNCPAITVPALTTPKSYIVPVLSASRTTVFTASEIATEFSASVKCVIGSY